MVFAAILTIWLNWHFFRAVSLYGTILLETGEFYGDRLLNMSIAKTAQELGINFLDPFNRMEPIFYQFPGWWGLGFLARFSGLHPWTVANLIHLFYVPAFFLIAWKLGGLIIRNRGAVIAGIAILFLFGNLEWFYSHEYQKVYGAHAIILPFLQQTFGFYIDSYGMLFGYGALFVWFVLLQAGSFDWKKTILFWIAATVSFCLHFLPALFFILAIMLLLFSSTLTACSTAQRKKIGGILAVIAILYLAALGYRSSRPPMAVIALTAGMVWLTFLRYDRNRLRYAVPLVPMAFMLLVAGANLLAFKAHYSFLLNDYNATVRSVDLAIPAHVLLICYFPVFVLALVSLVREEEERWRWIKWSLVLASLAVIGNGALGYNNHPYRYIPYTYPLWALLAGDGLVRLLRVWKNPIAATILALTSVTLCLGIWSNIDHRSRYSVGNSRQIDPLVLALAGMIETERKKDPGAIFYVEPVDFDRTRLGLDVSRLAPYTAAHFFGASDINFRSGYRDCRTAEEMFRTAHDNALRVDYLITYREMDGMTPLKELAWGMRRFRLYRLAD